MKYSLSVAIYDRITDCDLHPDLSGEIFTELTYPTNAEELFSSFRQNLMLPLAVSFSHSTKAPHLYVRVYHPGTGEIMVTEFSTSVLKKIRV